jgi:hypothetical protein
MIVMPKLSDCHQGLGRFRREEIATLASQASLEDLELLAKEPTILVPPKEANVMNIDLGTSDLSKMVIISAHLPKE